VHHNAGTSSPEIMELAVDVSDGILCRRHILHTGNDDAIRVLEDAISAVGRAGTPSVLITVRSVENPPVESSGVLAYKVGHRNDGLSNSRASEATVGGPLELCDTFLFGGTDSTPERSHVLTAATDVGLESIHDPPGAEKLALAGVFGCPGKNFVGSRRHGACRRRNWGEDLGTVKTDGE